MSYLASLPMYDWPELRTETDALYAGIRGYLSAAGFEPPELLTRADDPMTVWLSGEMLLSQTCGLPYVRHLRDKVQLLGTPVFALPGCQSGCYRSAIIVGTNSGINNLGDLSGVRAAVNGVDSQSGFAALNHIVLRAGGTQTFFSERCISGSHRASAAKVARGEADVCAIDPVSWKLIQDWDSVVASQLRVLDWSDSMPALPLVTGLSLANHELEALRDAVASAFSAPELEAERQALYLDGIASLQDSDYNIIADGWNRQLALQLAQ